MKQIVKINMLLLMLAFVFSCSNNASGNVDDEKSENVISEYTDDSLFFKALEEYANAEESKKKIDDYNFVEFDSTNYEKGNNAMDDFRRLLEDENISVSQLIECAEVANLSFDVVLFAGFKKKAQEERTVAFVSKRNADSVYAGVSLKERYTEGVENFREGDKTYALQNPEKAYEHYAFAKKIFDELYEEISARRLEAQKGAM